MCARTQDYRKSLKNLSESRDATTMEENQVCQTSEVSEATPFPSEKIQHSHVVKYTSKKELYIDGFVYNSDHKKAGRIYWHCEKYNRSSKKSCLGRAITSDPSSGEHILLYRGPNESKHNHPPHPVEPVECEKKENLSMIVEINAAERSDFNARSGIASVSSVSTEEAQEASEHELNSLQQSRKRKRASSPDLGDDAGPISTRLIGKRLCIDGYVYTKHESGPPPKWVCCRYRTCSCPARIITSDPLEEGEKLQVLKSRKVSEHNHPPSLEDVEDAEKLAKSGRKRVKCNSPIPSEDAINVSSHSGDLSSVIHSSLQGKIKNAASVKKSKLDHSSPSVTKTEVPMSSKQGKMKRFDFMTDPEIYRKFLTAFLENPVFDRKSVFEALKTIYSSKSGRVAAYVTILENREKVEKDLQALKVDPKFAISPINCLAICDGHTQVEANVNNLSTERFSNAKDSRIALSTDSLQWQEGPPQGLPSCEQQEIDAILPVSINEPYKSSPFETNSSRRAVVAEKESVSASSRNANQEQDNFSSGTHMPTTSYSINELANLCQNLPVREANTSSLITTHRQHNSPSLSRGEPNSPVSADTPLSGVVPSRHPSASIDRSCGDEGVNQGHIMVDLTSDDFDNEIEHIPRAHSTSLQDRGNQTNNYIGNAVNLHQMFEPHNFLIRQSSAPTLISCVQVPLVYDISRLPEGEIYDQEQFYTEIRVYHRSIEPQVYSLQTGRKN